MKFGWLTVQSFAGYLPDNKGKPYANWWCSCLCGACLIVKARGLKSRDTKSCGCYLKHAARERQTTHGEGKRPEYKVWSAMKQRCANPNNVNYKHYGGRGITVCERWQRYELFIEDMGPRPGPKHTLERIDNDGDYEPSNCAWTTFFVQARNRRSNVYLTVDGVTKMQCDWAKDLGRAPNLVGQRLAHGWSVEDAVLKKANRKNRYYTKKKEKTK